MTQEPSLAELLASLPESDPLLEWFAAEIADAPGSATSRSLEYALSVLRPCLTRKGDNACIRRLLRCLDFPDNRAVLEQARAQRKRGEYPSYQLRLESPDGEECFIRACPRPVRTPTGEAISLAGLEDVTAMERDRQTLCAKEQRFRLAVEAGKVCVWEWELQNGAMGLDPLFHTLLGFERDELNNAQDWLELVHPEDRPAFDQALQEHLDSKTPVFECEHRKLRKDGEILWFLSRGAAQKDGNGGSTLSGADLDITQRKQAEQAVEQERKRLYSLLDRLPAFVCLLAPDASIRFANRFFGEIVQNLDALKEYEQMHAGQEGEPGPLQEIFTIRSLSIWEWESKATKRVYRMYGYPFEDLDGSPLALELGIDITNSKRAREALRASEERYRSIAENLALGLAVLDKDLRLHSANPKLREWLPHVDLDAAPHCFDLLSSEGRGQTCPDCPVRWVKSDGKAREALLDLHLPNGARRMQVTYSPMFEPDGSVESVIMMVEDVTEKLEVQARLQRAHKLEAMGTLAGGIAHEINQPLNALQLYVSGLEMLVEKDHHLKRETLLTRLGWIMRESGKIHEIITHMRTLVHQEAGPAKPSAADLNDCVKDALSLLTAQLSAHGITLEAQYTSDLPHARANPVQLEQVVINLVVNAMQALDTLNSETAPNLQKRIKVETGRQEDMLRLVVRDNGPGLQGFEDRMFDPFFTSKEAGKGMGLGLSIVHTFVDSWGGEVRGHTLDSGGAEFTVRLLQAP